MGNENFRLSNLSITNTLGIGGIHVLALFALWPGSFSWARVALCLFLYLLTIWVGIGVGYHRLFTHNSFRAPKWLRYFLANAGALSLQGKILYWVGKHRVHHKHSDKEGDPHSPNDGFGWAHVFWVLFKISPEEKKEVLRVTQDLQRDRGMVFLDKFFWAPQVILAMVLFGFGFWNGGLNTAWNWVVWGVGVRTVAGYHATWLVNSTSHTWGYQTFDTGDRSTNCWWVALLSGGEGWHNNHHYRQTAASHGQKWWELDFNYLMIKGLSFVGLATNIVPFIDEKKEAH